jgi:hypothetical protein
MKMQSITIQGILLMALLPLLVQAGFSESCANEISTFVSMLPGMAWAWYGRVRQGDVTILGFKKKLEK